MAKIRIWYEGTKNGKKETAEVSVEAKDETAARKKFEGDFRGQKVRILGINR